jgi:hypothetical protein
LSVHLRKHTRVNHNTNKTDNMHVTPVTQRESFDTKHTAHRRLHRLKETSQKSLVSCLHEEVSLGSSFMQRKITLEIAVMRALQHEHLMLSAFSTVGDLHLRKTFCSLLPFALLGHNCRQQVGGSVSRTEALARAAAMERWLLPTQNFLSTRLGSARSGCKGRRRAHANLLRQSGNTSRDHVVHRDGMRRNNVILLVHL